MTEFVSLDAVKFLNFHILVTSAYNAIQKQSGNKQPNLLLSDDVLG